MIHAIRRPDLPPRISAVGPLQPNALSELHNQRMTSISHHVSPASDTRPQRMSTTSNSQLTRGNLNHRQEGANSDCFDLWRCILTASLMLCLRVVCFVTLWVFLMYNQVVVHGIVAMPMYGMELAFVVVFGSSSVSSTIDIISTLFTKVLSQTCIKYSLVLQMHGFQHLIFNFQSRADNSKRIKYMAYGLLEFGISLASLVRYIQVY